MKIFMIYPILAASVLVRSTSIEISSAPVALPDPESLINSISCAIFDVYKSAVVALHKYSSEALEAPSHHFEITKENEISSGTRSMLDVVRPDVNVVFGNFNAAITKLSDIMKEASDLEQAELQPAQVVWNELKYGVRSLKRNILLIRANMNKSLDEIRKNFDNGSEEFSQAMNDLYIKVSNKLHFEVRSATNMFQHALSLPNLKYYDIDLEGIYQNWTKFLQLSAKETPISLFKSAKTLINLIYNAIQSKFFLSSVLSDNSLWPLSLIVWGDAVQVKRFVDNSLRHLERYIRTSLAQIRTKFGKGSVALLEANQSLYNQIFSEVKQLIDLTEIPFKRIFNFTNEQLPFSTVCLNNPTYNGSFEELLKYLQERGYPVQMSLVECTNLMSSDTARSQAENFFDYLLEDTFKNSPTSGVFSTYTNILQEDRIKEVTDIYKRLFDVVQKCAETAHEDGYKLPETISMKIEDDANKYTLLMNDIRAYTCKSACLIEEYYSPPSDEYQNTINGLCENVKYKLDIAADYTLSSIKRLNNYLENHESCLEKFPLWTSASLAPDGSEDKDTIVLENLSSNGLRIVDVPTSVSEVDNIEQVGFRDVKFSNQKQENDNNNSLKITSGKLEKEGATLQVDAIKSETQCKNSKDAHAAITTLELSQGAKMAEEQEVSLLLDDIMPKSGVEDLTITSERTGMDIGVPEDETIHIMKSYKIDKTDSIDEKDETDLKISNLERKAHDFIDSSIEMSKRDKECTTESRSHSRIDIMGSNNMLCKTDDIQSNNFEERSLVAVVDHDVKPDKEPEDVLMNKIVSTEIIKETAGIIETDTKITENQFMYENTIHTDVSSEENQFDNLGTLISNDVIGVLDNIVSSEVQIDKLACTEDVKINQQATNEMLGLKRGNEELDDTNSIDSDITMKRSNKSSNLILDTNSQKLDDTEIIASRENNIINLDILEKSKELMEISSNSLTVDENDSHRLCKDTMSNLNMLEQEIKTSSNFNSQNSLQKTNEFDSNTEISHHKSTNVSREIEIPLNDRSCEKISNIKSESSQNTSTSLKMDSAMKNEARGNQEQILTDSEKVISSRNINDDLSSIVKIAKGGVNLIVNDECSTNSPNASNEQPSEVVEVGKCTNYSVTEYGNNVSTPDEMDLISKNIKLENAMSTRSEIEQISISPSQEDIQQSIILNDNSGQNDNKIDSLVSQTNILKKSEMENETTESKTSTISLKSNEQGMKLDSNFLTKEHDLNDYTVSTRSLVSPGVCKDGTKTVNCPTQQLNEESKTTCVQDGEILLSNILSNVNIIKEQDSLVSQSNLLKKSEIENETIESKTSSTTSLKSNEQEMLVDSNFLTKEHDLNDVITSTLCVQEEDKNLIEEIIEKNSSTTENTVYNNNIACFHSDSNDTRDSNICENIEKKEGSSKVCSLMLGDDEKEEEEKVIIPLNGDIIMTQSFDMYKNNEKNDKEHTSIMNSLKDDDIANGKISKSSVNNLNFTQISDSLASIRKNNEEDREIGTTGGTMVDDLITEKMLNSSSNNDLSIILNSDSQKSIENSMKRTEIGKNDLNTLPSSNSCENNEENAGIGSSAVIDDAVNEKIVSARNNNLLNKECVEESSSTVENSKVSHSLASYQSIRKIDEVTKADEDMPQKLIGGENNAKNNYREISKSSAKSVHMIDDKMNDEDSTIDNVEKQVESNEIHENVGESKLENIERALEVGGSCVQLSGNEIHVKSDILNESSATFAENHKYNEVIKNPAIATQVMMDSVDKQFDVSILDNQIGNTLKTDSNEKTIDDNQNSITIDNTIAYSSIDFKKDLIETNSTKENKEDDIVINKEQKREETKLANIIENEMISNIKDEETTTLETSKSSTVIESELNISAVNENSYNGEMQPSKTNNIVSKESNLRENSETHLENISIKDAAEQETLPDEFSTSNDATTIVKKTIVRNEIEKQKTDISFENLLSGSQPESIIPTGYTIPAAEESFSLRKVEKNEDDYLKTEPSYHIAWFPKKSSTPVALPPVNPSDDDNYDGWLGWLIPGKRSFLDTNSENFSNALGRVYDSRTKFLTTTSDKQLETSNTKNVEMESSSSISTSETQSSFTKTNSVDDSTETEITKPPKSNVNVVNDFSEMGISDTNCIERPEDAIFFKKWYNSFVKTK